MNAIPLYVTADADEFWPAVVQNGIVVHVHTPSQECNVKCYVRQNLDGLERRNPPN